MAMRAGASSPCAAAIQSATAPSSCSITARTNAACRSGSDGMHALENLRCFRGLAEQYAKRRDVGVPLDQRGTLAEACNRFPVQGPDLVGHGRAVRIDQAGSRRVEAGQVYLLHRRGGYCGQIGPRIEAV